MARLLWFFLIPGLFVISVLSGLVTLTPGVVAILLLCGACELMDSSLGMGYGTTLTPILITAGYEPLQLVPTILVSEFLSGFAASFFHSEAGNVEFNRGSIHLRAAVILSISSVVGVLAGVQLAFQVSRDALTQIIGVVITVSGLYILLASGRVFRFQTWKVVILAAVASFNKAVSGGGYGPLMTSGQVVSGIEGRSAVAITSLAEGFTCLAGSILFLMGGLEIDPQLLIPVATGALLTVPTSARIVRRFSERILKRVIGALTLLMGIFMLFRAIS